MSAGGELVLLVHGSKAPVERLRGFFPEWSLERLQRPGRRYAALLSYAGDEGDFTCTTALAERMGARWMAWEDGLIRSVGGASTGAPPLSIILDTGAAHHGLAASGLDRLLDAEGSANEASLSLARDLMEYKRRHGLGRTNDGAPAREWLGLERRRARVLVVDRAASDRFLGRTSPPRTAFEAMFDAARRDHPTAEIIVRREPGERPGLSAGSLARAHHLVSDDIDVASLIGEVDAVYTVASLIGWEALLSDRPVVCFGNPFYSGRGLTDDRNRQISTASLRSIEEVFAAAYLLASRYVDPLTGRRCPADVAFERLAAMKRHATRVAGHWVGEAISPPKQPVMRAFLEGPRSTYSYRRRRASRAVTAVWASRSQISPQPGLRANVEDGFLRSVGLGSSFHPASSLVLDWRGIYYDPSRPSDLELLLNSSDVDDRAIMERARRLRGRIVELGLSKYNIGEGAQQALQSARGGRTILVPGQVGDDASVLKGGGGWTNLDLLRRVRRDNPQAWIVYKEHPDVVAGNRRGAAPSAETRTLADQIVADGDISAWIERSDEVHTISSLAGFEALLRGKAVVTYGWPFFAGWGLTRDLGPKPGPRRRPLPLDSLVAGALILYPLYLDPVSRLPCSAETFVERLAAGRDRGVPVARLERLTRFARALRETFRFRRPTRY